MPESMKLNAEICLQALEFQAKPLYSESVGKDARPHPLWAH